MQQRYYIADLFYRLSTTRRVQIALALNLIKTKTTTDALPADNFLFGASFGKELKKGDYYV